MKRCVVVGGAKIENYELIRNALGPDDFVIYCDGGLNHKESLGAKPDLIVGDFDSYKGELTDDEIIVLPCRKDDTDTVFAVKEALKRGFEDFLLVGVTGQRLDHTIGNLSILLMLDSLHKTAKIIDDCSEMEIVSDKRAFVDDSFSYFSLLNISGTAKGITIKNAEYELENGQITCEYQYGISNEVLKGKTAEISLSEGRLLLIKVY